MSYSEAWRNRRAPLYTQFCYLHEANHKLQLLIEKHGAAFDDEWQYRLAGRTAKVITRKPLWLNIIESGRFAEKHRGLK